MKILKKDNGASYKDVIRFIENNINAWLATGYAPCQKTTIEMQGSIFSDVTSFEFNNILKNYCKEHNIIFEHGKRQRVDSKVLRCFVFRKKI